MKNSIYTMLLVSALLSPCAVFAADAADNTAGAGAGSGSGATTSNGAMPGHRPMSSGTKSGVSEATGANSTEGKAMSAGANQTSTKTRMHGVHGGSAGATGSSPTPQ